MVTLDGDWSDKEQSLVTQTGHRFREDQHGAMGQSADLVVSYLYSYSFCTVQTCAVGFTIGLLPSNLVL